MYGCNKKFLYLFLHKIVHDLTIYSRKSTPSKIVADNRRFVRRKRKFNKTLLILPVHSPPSEHGAGNVAPSAILTVVDDGCFSSESLVAAERTGIKDVDGSNVTILTVLESSIARLEDGDSTDVTSTVGATIVVACDAWLTEYDGGDGTAVNAATFPVASDFWLTKVIDVVLTTIEETLLEVSSDF